MGEWQNSHYHKCLTEFYIVQVGWIIYTELAKEGTLTLKYVGEGENTIVKPMVHHNIYMSPSTITHVVKYGVSSENIDWFGSPELDKLTKHLKASELVQFLDN
ncbi:MAG: hypothetical protein K0R57_565 [Paenibacillaceae bacterium]|nr:hypothetical protein [Paenibacillaceae bacterium]